MFDSDSDDGQDGRREAKRYELGVPHPACSAPGCGESDPIALTGVAPNIRCYEHDRLRRGRSPVERQHPAGRHNLEVTVPIGGNDHRVIDDLKYDWPPGTLRNPDGSPLLRAAACLRGWLDTLQIIVSRTVGWIPAFLEALDAWLTITLGGFWWTTFPGPTGPVPT